ncbi:probable serine/threonine-protein kinase WNK11 [Phalaenopsis equestris]|uniref:probable serine/threonine-protein kinase WNK11 n=1 Tax=Phalaenopsis equestris TaxID=78828 RepID=UPI0009E3B2DD|nr:probable serine/threonine-protein kinase WNK11 [Phalaenopsis equestris]
MSWVQRDPSDNDREPFVEMDPTGRYGRYADILGIGATKKVYRGFDQEDGIEVAWNQVTLRSFKEDSQMLNRIFSEVRLLRSLRHENIIMLYNVWTDDEAGTLNFITEVCTSGNLREYRKKHCHVSLKALKKWCRQILVGLDYLHKHDPCIIHRDLNCSNVFMNGNTGEVKIGDLGLAAVVGNRHLAHSILGTPEFMAPELYEEDYTEQVDIYSFGMCVLEMMTNEIPYSECDSVPKIYRKVTAGIRPASLSKVRDHEIHSFIERCLGNPRFRPSASELLKDHFFAGLEVMPTAPPLPWPPARVPSAHSVDKSGEQKAADHSTSSATAGRAAATML